MLRSALSQLLGANAEQILISAGIDPTDRGEVLTVEQFYSIGKKLANGNSTK